MIPSTARGTLNSVRARIRRRLQFTAALLFVKRIVKMRNCGPLISFTFDDFPRSALFTGGAILKNYGISATYYASLGLAGKMAPTGQIFHPEELSEVVERGHELGCHTFAHCNASSTPAREFERSILENRNRLSDLLPGLEFQTHSYPIATPNLGVKRRASQYFIGCRGGGQTFNSERIDRNFLRAFFLEQSLRSPETIERLISLNCTARGWLIFATHDVCQAPTRFGCDPSFFEKIVKLSVNSGSQILSVSKALGIINEESAPSGKDTSPKNLSRAQQAAQH